MKRRIFTVIVFTLMVFLLGANATAAGWINLPNPNAISERLGTFMPIIFNSADATYYFSPGTSFVPENSSDSLEWILVKKSAQIYSGKTTGPKLIYIPIPLPSVIEGNPVRVTEVTVYYKCSNGEFSYIDRTLLTKYTGEVTLRSLAKDEINRDANDYDEYTLTTTDENNLLSPDEGILNLVLTLTFKDPAHYIEIGGARVKLEY